MNVEKFIEIFSGLERAYGSYEPDGNVRSDGKKGGKAFINKRLVTKELWVNHLQGKQSLGIIPITDNSTCRWGCIDIDVYEGFDHSILIKQIEKNKLPVVVCRSKSGGAHIFIFTTEPISAKLMRLKLHEFRALLNYGDAEVFPKQTELDTERGDTGNFLNLPYFDGDRSVRYGFNEKAESLSVDDFIDFVQTKIISEKDLKSFKLKKRKTKEEPEGLLADGPPCLQGLAQDKIQKGMRNECMFQYSVYAKKKWANENWQSKVHSFNTLENFTEILDYRETDTVIKEQEKKDYGYKCKTEPFKGRCNRTECRSRKWGIGDFFEPQISGLQKYETDDPQWYLNFTIYTDEGEEVRRIKCNTEELFDQRKFRKKCMDVLTVLPDAMGGDDWTKKLQTLMADADVIKMEEEISKGGQFDQHLKSFLTDQGISDDVRDLLVGNPVRKRINIKNDEDQTEEIDAILFNPKDVVDYCTKKKFTALDQTRMILRIKESFKGDSHKLSVDNNKKYVWFVPDDFQKPKDIEIPDMKKAEPF